MSAPRHVACREVGRGADVAAEGQLKRIAASCSAERECIKLCNERVFDARFGFASMTSRSGDRVCGASDSIGDAEAVVVVAPGRGWGARPSGTFDGAPPVLLARYSAPFCACLSGSALFGQRGRKRRVRRRKLKAASTKKLPPRKSCFFIVQSSARKRSGPAKRCRVSQ